MLQRVSLASLVIIVVFIAPAQAQTVNEIVNKYPAATGELKIPWGEPGLRNLNGGQVIRKGTSDDFKEVLAVINDAAIAYKGVIPSDRWHEPYMTKEELQAQIEGGVEFSCYVENKHIIGIMGIQDKEDVRLIRHAYVRTKHRNQGIGTLLLQELIMKAKKPILIGTWKTAEWAIRFYEKNGFRLVGKDEANRLLRKYWSVPDRQIETSVVLAGGRYTG